MVSGESVVFSFGYLEVDAVVGEGDIVADAVVASDSESENMQTEVEGAFPLCVELDFEGVFWENSARADAVTSSPFWFFHALGLSGFQPERPCEES